MKAALLFALVLGSAAQVSAQSGAATVPLPRVFAGVGAGFADSDASSRMRIFKASNRIWVADGGVALAPRIGLGVEFAQPTAATATTSGGSFRDHGRQEERVLAGLLRVRLTGRDRVAVDAVAGAGVLFQHHESRFEPCFLDCVDGFRREVRNRRSPAFVIGADVPVRAGRHFWVAAYARLYALRRGNDLTELPVEVPWQFESTSSTRFSIGFSARAGW